MARRSKKDKLNFKGIVTDPDYVPYTFVNGNIKWNFPYMFDGSEQQRPRCINPGCIEPVAYTSTSTTGLRVLRTVCSSCHRKGHRNIKLDDHITAHKKTYCENIDSHLGFDCTSTIHFNGNLELDHVDGNHYHNLPYNVETLCKICHSYKSHLNGDCR